MCVMSVISVLCVLCLWRVRCGVCIYRMCSVPGALVCVSVGREIDAKEHDFLSQDIMKCATIPSFILGFWS